MKASDNKKAKVSGKSLKASAAAGTGDHLRDRIQRLATQAREVPTWAYVTIGLLALLTVARFAVIANQGMSADGTQIFDDALYVRLAFYIRHGMWLGPFDKMTFAKGPMYPMWIAAVASLGAPLLLAQQMLYTAACALFAYVVRPVLRSWKAAGGLYAMLLLSPIVFADGVATRVLREGIYISLTLLVLACAIRLWTHASGKRRAWLGWSIALGVLTAALWLTREEGVWIAPLLLLPAVTTAASLATRRWDVRAALRNLAPWAIAAAIAVALVTLVAWNNQRVYGVFRTTDTTSGPFLAAYGALTRVTPEHWVADVPVPKDVRLKLYGVSAAFAELAPSLEGTTGVQWTQEGGGTDLRGGFFMWALRDAVESRGYYQSAVDADAYYQRVADQVNSACDQGVLPSVGSRATLAPPWHSEYWAPFADASLRSIEAITTYSGITPVASPSRIPAQIEAGFTSMTNESYVGYGETPPLRPAATAILSAVLTVYGWLTPLAALLGLLGIGVIVTDAVRERWRGRILATVVLLGTLLALVASRVVVISLIDATSFAAVSPIYLAPAYDLVLALSFISVYVAVSHIRARLAEKTPR